MNLKANLLTTGQDIGKSTLTVGKRRRPIHTRLPDEIFLLIFQFIEPDVHLIKVANASPRLNYLSLDVLFSRHKVNISTGNVYLGSKFGGSGMNALPGLAMALAADNAVLNYLYCDMTENLDTTSNMLTNMAGHARALARFVARLSSVKCVSLKVLFLMPGAAGDAFLDLLKVIMSRSCRSLHVKPLLLRTSHQRRSDIQKDLQQDWTSTILPHVPFIKNFFPSIQEERPLVQVSTQLEVCRVETLPDFLRPFYAGILAASPQLMDLSFTHIPVPRALAALIEGVYFPALSSLAITHCTVIPSVLADFLIRHPTITTLNFHNITLWESFPARLVEGTLPALKSLKTSPRNLIHYLPNLYTFSALESVTLLVAKKKPGFERLTKALYNMSTCENRISLTLEFTGVDFFKEWLSAGLIPREARKRRPERLMYCLRELKIDTHLRRPFESAVLDLFPLWLGLFPALEDVAFTHRCLPRELHVVNENQFIHNVSDACPPLKNFRLDLSGRKTRLHI